jgi:hypothetical protein
MLPGMHWLMDLVSATITAHGRHAAAGAR